MTTDVVLLRRAVDYALNAIDTVTPDLLSRPTPCSEWNLRMLLSHACESVAALQEGLDRGRVSLLSTEDDEAAADVIRFLRRSVTRLLDAWTVARDERIIAVADLRIPLPLMAGTAALEVTVHGWDVFQAGGHDRPIPSGLAADLLSVARLLVPDNNRRGLFDPPVPMSPTAGPSDVLLAFLGRPAGAARPPTAVGN